MTVYRTAEVAARIGVHPNTVRLYEKWGLVPAAQRQANGYRVFTEFHLRQFRLARTALQTEVLQNGLRKKMIAVVKCSAQRDFEEAILLAEEYLAGLQNERGRAEEAVCTVRRILSGGDPDASALLKCKLLKRGEASEALGISVDTLRNWEMNGLLTVKRKQNGYRVYTPQDIKRLKIIRSLRCANYSLEAIRRMLRQLSQNPDTDIRQALNTPQQDDDIVSVCDRLIVSLCAAEQNAIQILDMLREMKKRF